MLELERDVKRNDYNGKIINPNLVIVLIITQHNIVI